MLQNVIQSYHAELLNSGVLTRSFDTVWASPREISVTQIICGKCIYMQTVTKIGIICHVL